MRYLFASLAFITNMAVANPFHNGDVVNGKTLFLEYDCSTCHQAQVGGDGSYIFTRANRKVHAPNQLIQQIERCPAGSKLDSKEKQDLGAYLNQKYYQFK